MIVPFSWRLVHADVVWGEAETIRPLYPLLPYMPRTAEWQYMDGVGRWHFYMSLYEWWVVVRAIRMLHDYYDEPTPEQVQFEFYDGHITLEEAFAFTTDEWRDRKWQRAVLKGSQIGNGKILQHGALGPRL